MSNNHLVGEIPTQNHEMLRKYEIDENLRDVDPNAFQKAIDASGAQP